MKKRNKVLSLLSLLTVSLGLSVNAMSEVETQAVNDNTVVSHWTKDNTMYKETIHLEDKNQNLIDFNSNELLDNPGGIADGKVRGFKQTDFKDATDAKNGVVRSQLDVFGQDMSEGSETVFALDVSGSMSMYANNAYMIVKASPDINFDHYYCITDLFENTINEENKCSNEKEFVNASVFEGYIWEETFNKGLYKSIDGLEGVTYKEVNSTSFNSWDPNEHIYYLENNKYVHISPDRSNKPDGWDSGLYYSPSMDDGSNPHGLLDRMMVQNRGAYAAIKNILNKNPNNTVSLVMFAGTVKKTVVSSDNIDDFKFLITDAQLGYGGTGYKTALEEVNDIVTNSTKKIKNLVFVSDGAPWPENTEGNFTSEINKLNAANVTRYAVGIDVHHSVNAEKYLRLVATSEEYYSPAKASSEVEKALVKIADALVINPEVQYHDTIADEFDLIIDDKHPMTLLNKHDGIEDVITSLDEFKDSKLVSYDENTRTLTIHGVEVDEQGLRAVYFTKVKEEHYKNGFLNKPSQESYYEYKKVYKEDNKIYLNATYDDKIPVSENLVNIKQAKLNISLISDKMSNNDPSILGQVVNENEEIKYTIQLESSGPLAFDKIDVIGLIPNNTTYLKEGLFEDGKVYFKDQTILANSKVEYDYYVTNQLYTTDLIHNQSFAQRNNKVNLEIVSNTLDNPMIKDITDPTNPTNPSNPNENTDNNTIQNPSTQDSDEQPKGYHPEDEEVDNQVNKSDNNTPSTGSSDLLVALGALSLLAMLLFIYKRRYQIYY